jgi:hypothetical protein
MRNHFAESMANQFGNYLCQKIIEVSSPPELASIIEVICPFAVQISYSVHGTRAMQSLIEMTAKYIPSLESLCLALIDSLQTEMLQLCKDSNGNHVIQAFLTSFKCGD